MYITAQRVISSKGRGGVNAFLYLHGPRRWLAPPAPENDPGELTQKLISVEAPGNRVRSYLDIVAPDGISPADVRHALTQLVAESQRHTLPWKGVYGPCLVRFGAEVALARQWHTELADLFRCIEAVRSAST